MSAPGVKSWDDLQQGPRRWPLLAKLVATCVIVLASGATAIGMTGFLLVQQAEASLTRVPLASLDPVSETSDARHFLIVGSDSREGLTSDERQELVLGAFEGQQSDTIIYVTISQDREGVSLVSLPRDLLVYDREGRRGKLAEQFAGGPNGLISAIQHNFGLPVHHYAAISLGGFIRVVQTLGGVEIDIPERLVDQRSGADFEPGRQHLDAQQALAYIRSRSGVRADFERIDRQQRFILAVLRNLTDRRVLADPRRVFQLVDDVASNVTTDESLGVGAMYSLADELRTVVADGLPMVTVPAYTRRVDGIDFVVAYRPGAEKMFEELRSGRVLSDRGTADARRQTLVAVWWGSHLELADGIVLPTLLYAGFSAGGAGVGPAAARAQDVTRVFVIEGYEAEAGWVASTLGVEPEPLPDGTTAPASAKVVVSTGADAAS